MKTRLHPENPFENQSKGFLWETLRSRGGDRKPVHLDYGAYDGSVLRILAETGVIERGVGVDLNADVVRANQSRLPPNVVLKAVQKSPRLDFPDESFDSISIIGVIEHICDQKAILTELGRLLKKDGVLVLAVPGRHLFSFLDMGNFKFVFPRLHRVFYTWQNSAEKYHERYVECRNGMFGDIETEKGWHEHFSHEQLGALLGECGFEVTKQDGFGFFNRILINAAYFLPNPVSRAVDRLVQLDAEAFDQAEIFVSAQKRN